MRAQGREASLFSMGLSESVAGKVEGPWESFPAKRYLEKDNPTRAWFQPHVLLLPVIRFPG
jgi:hypothetical protein